MPEGRLELLINESNGFNRNTTAALANLIERSCKFDSLRANFHIVVSVGPKPSAGHRS